MRVFTTEQGLAALAHLLETGAVNTAVMPVDLASWRRNHPAANQSSLLAHLRQTEMDVAAPTARAEETAASPRAALEAAAPAARRELAEHYLRQQISRVLRMPPERLDSHQSLNNLGIDSLMAVELRNHVQAHLGVMIPLAKLLQDPTIAQLSDVILQQLGDVPPSEQVAEQAAIPHEMNAASAAPDVALENLEELTDEQVDAMLRQMLKEDQQQA
jgi:aryl carrier-like protein